MSIESAWIKENDSRTSDLAERALLAGIILSPPFLRLAEDLEPKDFRSSYRGVVLEAIRIIDGAIGPTWDSIVLMHQLEDMKAQPPPEITFGWASAIGSLLDTAHQGDVFPEESTIRVYVGIIREAAMLRRYPG